MFNNKILTIVFFLMFCTHKVYAKDENKYVPYIGLGYINSYEATEINRFHNNSLNVKIGSEYNRYFSTELFFTRSDIDNATIENYLIKNYYYSYGLDLIGYLPIDCVNKYFLLGNLGWGKYNFRVKNHDIGSYRLEDDGYRFGLGVKYDINANWKLNFISRYVYFNDASEVNHLFEHSINLEYHFW